MDDRAGSLLDDILVVEIGERIAVGACGSLLAQLGARVVVIEPEARSTCGKWRNRAAMMAGKLSVVVNPDDDADRALRDALLVRADIVLLSSDFGGGSDSSWETPADVRQIVVDITAMGHGAEDGRPASEELIQARGGLIDTTGPADRPPSAIGTPVLEMHTAVASAAAILVALRVRRMHGFGQRIDMSILDGAVNSLTNFLALHFGGLPASRAGNRHPLYAPWGSYRAADGHLLLCSVSDEQFARICRAMDDPALAQDPRFATATLRRHHYAEIDSIISTWATVRSVADCIELLMECGVACGPIVNVDMLEDEPNLVHRGTLQRLLDPETGTSARVSASPIRGIPLSGLAPTRIPARNEDRATVSSMLTERASSRTAAVEHQPSQLDPLAGLRVIEIGHYTVAPLASRHMGAFGADVIKIEPPAGDAIRSGPPLRDDGLSYIFALSNTDKRGLMLDLRKEQDRQRLHRLLGQSDVLLENLRPGALEKLGFGSELLRERHPHLVYCSITGFGRDSIYRGRPALDTVIQAMSGMMSLTRVDGVPTKAGISASDVAGGLFGLLAALAGIEYRDQTGRAAHFDISMQDASVWMTQIHWSGVAGSTTRMVHASDGYVVVQGDAERIDDVLAEIDEPLFRAGLAALLSSEGLDAASVLSVAEVVNDSRSVQRELFVECHTQDNDVWRVPQSPLGLCSTPPRVRSVISRLGFENDERIAELRLDEEQALAASAAG